MGLDQLSYLPGAKKEAVLDPPLFTLLPPYS
jgi:hypothetical protein